MHVLINYILRKLYSSTGSVPDLVPDCLFRMYLLLWLGIYVVVCECICIMFIYSDFFCFSAGLITFFFYFVSSIFVVLFS